MELSRAQTEDPHRRSATACVDDCESVGEASYDVRLSETIFYPEGGGQPADRGRIGDAEVTDVQRDADGRILHRVDRRLEVARDVELEIDWSRRLDLMQQHTAQHLITAVADDAFDLATVSFHLGSEEATIDLDAQSVSRPELEAIEERVNEEIRGARPVRFEFVSPEDYEAMDVRSRGLPDDHSGDVRIVEIEGLDRNTCGGTHVGNLAEIQAVKLLGAERTRDRVRVVYLAGRRVLDRLEGCLDRESALNELLSCGYDEHVEAVERTVREATEATNRVTAYQEELASYLADELVASEGPVAELHRRETDFQFLNDVAGQVRARDPERAVFLTAAEPLHDDEGMFLLAGPEDWVEEYGPEVAEALDGRGGGPPGVYQGRAEGLDERDAVLERLEATR